MTSLPKRLMATRKDENDAEAASVKNNAVPLRLPGIDVIRVSLTSTLARCLAVCHMAKYYLLYNIGDEDD